jgi:hypothetical protein
VLASAAMGEATCPPSDYSRAELLALRDKQFRIENEAERNALAVALLPCLKATDPKLRDSIAFEALSTLMRGKKITPATATEILNTLIPWLANKSVDSAGVAQPFAALALSEIARMDRIDSFLSDDQRKAFIAQSVHYLNSVRDYRGFDERIGWRHGVAHGADLMLQLALNEKVGRAESERILDALATQIVPHNAHFYVYGESERIARPVFYIARRGILDSEWWQSWLAKVASPAPYSEWAAVYESQAGLAKRHNTATFLNALHVYVIEANDPVAKAQLLPALSAAIKQLP